MFTPRLDHLPKMRLGDTCRLLDITPRAFRFYEEQGLLEASRDPLNHRYIDGATRRRLAWIVRLRKAGLTIQDVRKVLQAEDTGREHRDFALERLEDRKRQLFLELAEVDALMADLSAERDGAPISAAA
jgi:DNA-binding transcriptional MerR regulator